MKTNVFADNATDGERAVNPYQYGTAKEFADAFPSEEFFYVGPLNSQSEIPGKLPEVAWYMAKYAEHFDFDIVAAVFNDYGFASGKNLVDMPGLEATLKLARKYVDASDLAQAYMDAHKVPEAVQLAVDDDKLVDTLTKHRVIDTRPLIVLWEPTDPAITEGWG